MKFYQVNDRTCALTIYTQNIIADPKNRMLRNIVHSNNVEAFVFRTTQMWEDEGLSWAQVDYDLVSSMLQKSRYIGFQSQKRW